MSNEGRKIELERYSPDLLVIQCDPDCLHVYWMLFAGYLQIHFSTFPVVRCCFHSIFAVCKRILRNRPMDRPINRPSYIEMRRHIKSLWDEISLTYCWYNFYTKTIDFCRNNHANTFRIYWVGFGKGFLIWFLFPFMINCSGDMSSVTFCHCWRLCNLVCMSFLQIGTL